MIDVVLEKKLTLMEGKQIEGPCMTHVALTSRASPAFDASPSIDSRPPFIHIPSWGATALHLPPMRLYRWQWPSKT